MTEQVSPEGGFALVMVLWVLAVLALALSALSSSTTQMTFVARNEIERVRATHLLDAGIRLAIQDLLAGPEQDRYRRFSVPAGAVVCRMPDGELVSIRIDDEGGKVDLNVASDELMGALLAGLGVAGADVAALVDTIAVYRGEDAARRPKAAVDKDYADAGRARGPKRAVFDAVSEIGNVLGIDAQLFRRLRPLVTTVSGARGVDPRVASPAMRDLLSTTEIDKSSPLSAAGAISPRLLAPSAGKAFTISAGLRLNSGARFFRRALVTRVDGATLAASPAAGAEPLAENMSRPRPRTGQAPVKRRDVFRIHEWDSVQPDGHELTAPLASASNPDC